MEKQWKTALEAVDQDKNKQTIDLLKEELKSKDNLIINLRRDN
jgi:hypothetical protein